MSKKTVDFNFVATLFLVPAPFSLIAMKVFGTPWPVYVGLGSLIAAAVLWFIAPYQR